MSMLFAVGMFLCGLRTQSSACLLTVFAILTQAKISNLLRVSRFSSPVIGLRILSVYPLYASTRFS